MQLSQLPTLKTSRSVIDQFAGYNHNKRIQSNEFYDSLNLTLDEYPLATVTKQRALLKNAPYPPEDPQEPYLYGNSFITVGDEMFVIEGKYFKSATDIDAQINLNLSNGEKQLANMGGYVIIMPDKKFVNVLKRTQEGELLEYGDIESEFVPKSNNKNIYIIPSILGDMSNLAISTTDPTADVSSKPGDYWVDISEKPYSLKIKSKSGTWQTIATSYLRISFYCDDDITRHFKVGDAVTFKKNGNIGAINSTLWLLNQTYIIQELTYEKQMAYIKVIGQMPSDYDYLDPIKITDKSPLKIERKMPDMDYIAECNNRLWGCKYGEKIIDDNVVETINEIYSSKLGDFKNWNCFEGLATDSYVASIGVSGKFTGAVKYGGKPMFFKEHTIFRVNGDFPSNYQISEQNCDGVANGNSKSLAVVNGALFYNSTNGICVYDGTAPTNISYQIGEKYENAVGCGLGNKYYVELFNTSEVANRKGNLFVYDTTIRGWEKESPTNAIDMIFWKENLYYIPAGSDEPIHAIMAKNIFDIPIHENVDWMAETGLIGLDLPSRKYISRITLRVSLEQGSRFNVFIQYDSQGGWENVLTLSGTSTKSFSVPIKPKRCDHFKLKFIGKGGFKMYSISKTIEQGSEI